MGVTSENKTVQEEGQDKEALVVSFTNGAKQQLEELKQFFGAPDLLEVVKLGITILERVKEDQTVSTAKGKANATKEVKTEPETNDGEKREDTDN